MRTSQYKDRIEKEINGKLNPGEYQFKVPMLTVNKDKILPKTEGIDVFLQKPVIEEWKDVFNIE